VLAPCRYVIHTAASSNIYLEILYARLICLQGAVPRPVKHCASDHSGSKQEGRRSRTYRVQGVQALNARRLASVAVGLGSAHQHNLQHDSTSACKCSRRSPFHNQTRETEGTFGLLLTPTRFPDTGAGTPGVSHQCPPRKHHATGGPGARLDGQGGDDALRVHQPGRRAGRSARPPSTRPAPGSSRHCRPAARA